MPSEDRADLSAGTSHDLETTWIKRECPHCREFHEVSVVTEPGWEQIVYCPRTGDAG